MVINNNNEQKKFFSKLVQTNYIKGNSDFKTNEKNIKFNIKECFDQVLQSNYKNQNYRNTKILRNEKNYFFSNFHVIEKIILENKKNNFYKIKNGLQKNLKLKIEIKNNFNYLLNQKKRMLLNNKEIEKNYDFQNIKNSIKNNFEIINPYYIFQREKIIFKNSIKKNYNISITKKIKKFNREKNYLFLNRKINRNKSLKQNYIFSQNLKNIKLILQIKRTNKFVHKKSNNLNLISKSFNLLINKKNNLKNIRDSRDKIKILIPIKKNFEKNYFSEIAEKKIELNDFLFTIIKIRSKKNEITKNSKKNYFIINKKGLKNFYIKNFGTIFLNEKKESLFNLQNLELFFRVSKKNENNFLKTQKFFILKNLLKNKNILSKYDFNLFENIKKNRNELKISNFNFFINKSNNQISFDIQICNIFTNFKNNNEFSLKDFNYFSKEKIFKDINLQIKKMKILQQKKIKNHNIKKKSEIPEIEEINENNSNNIKTKKQIEKISEAENPKKNNEFENKNKSINSKNSNELAITNSKTNSKNKNELNNTSKNTNELNNTSRQTNSKNTNYFDSINKNSELKKIKKNNSKKIEDPKKIDYVKKYTKTKNKLCQLTCVYRLNDKKHNNKIFELTTKLNNQKDNPGKLQMMKELIKKMEIEMDFLTRKLEKILSKIDVKDYNSELENKNKKLFLVIKNLQEKLKYSNVKLKKVSKKKKYCEENLCFTNKFLEYVLMNFFKFDYKKIDDLYCFDSFSEYKENLKVVMNLLEKCFLELNKEKSKFQNLESESAKDNLKINFVIIDYLKKNLRMKNKMKDLSQEKSNFEDVMETVTNFGFEKEQIKSSFLKFFYFIKIKKFKELQMVSKVILDLLDLDNEEKNEILETLLNLL